jgi:hypothetical protein
MRGFKALSLMAVLSTAANSSVTGANPSGLGRSFLFIKLPLSHRNIFNQFKYIIQVDFHVEAKFPSRIGVGLIAHPSLNAPATTFVQVLQSTRKLPPRRSLSSFSWRGVRLHEIHFNSLFASVFNFDLNLIFTGSRCCCGSDFVDSI